MVKSCYETYEVVSQVNKEALPTDFFLDYAFPSANTVVTDADKVVIGRYTEAQACMAPYTDPCGPGVALKRPETSADLSELAPPTIKLKETIVPCDGEQRRIDPKTGMFVSTHQERMDLEVGEKGAIMRNAILERMRFTAAQVLHNGGYVIDGDEVKSTILDFKRDPKLSLDLVATSGDTWDLNTSDPDALLEAITEVMLCYGIAGFFDVIYSPSAWKWRKKHIELDRRDFNYSTGQDTVLDTAVATFNYAQFKGQSGQYRHWLVNQKYKIEDPNNPGMYLMQDMIPDGSILIVQREAFRGQRVYGGIRRVSGDTEMTPIWYRDMIDDECEVRKLQAWSRPMLIPGNPNASAFVQVVDPALPCVDLCPTC